MTPNKKANRAMLTRVEDVLGEMAKNGDVTVVPAPEGTPIETIPMLDITRIAVEHQLAKFAEQTAAHNAELQRIALAGLAAQGLQGQYRLNTDTMTWTRLAAPAAP